MMSESPTLKTKNSVSPALESRKCWVAIKFFFYWLRKSKSKDQFQDCVERFFSWKTRPFSPPLKKKKESRFRWKCQLLGAETLVLSDRNHFALKNTEENPPSTFVPKKRQVYNVTELASTSMGFKHQTKLLPAIFKVGFLPKSFFVSLLLNGCHK